MLTKARIEKLLLEKVAHMYELLDKDLTDSYNKKQFHINIGQISALEDVLGDDVFDLLRKQSQVQYQPKVVEEEPEGKHLEFSPESWATKLEEMLKDTLVMQCTNSEYEGVIRQQGDIVKVSKLYPFTENLCVSYKKFFAFKVNDVVKVQRSEELMEAHLCNARRSIREVLEEELLSLHNCVAHSNTFKVESLNKDNIYEHFVKLAITLKNSKFDDHPWVIVNPSIESILIQSCEFISAHKIADKSLRGEAIGRIAGMDVMVTTCSTLDKEDNFVILAGTNDAITLASKLVKLESLRDRDTFADLVRGLFLYGTKVIYEKALAKLIVKS